MSEYSIEHTGSNPCPSEKTSPSLIGNDRQHESPVPDAAENAIKPPARSQVEVIDIESDEEEADAQVSLQLVPQLMPDSLRTVFGLDGPLKPTQSIQDVVNDVNADDHGSVDNITGANAEFEPEKLDTYDENSSSNLHSALETLPPSPSDLTKLAEPAHVSEAPLRPIKSDERLLSPLVSPPILPATIDDSVKQVEEAEISSLYKDQISNIDSQPSTTISRSVEDEYEEMIPHLTQETSAGILPPEFSTEASLLPSEAQEMEALQSKPAQPDETVQNNLQKHQSETIDFVEANGEGPREGNTDESRTSERAPQETPLVRRLKQQRRLSRLQQHDQSDTPNTASPWFARPSTDQSRLQKTDKRLATPEPSYSLRSASSVNASPEVSLPKVSAQTPPLRSSPPRTPTSSQYVPASQPATGFRTKLSYFVPLASLQHHYGTEVDVLAIVVAANSIVKAESGPKDYVLSLHVIDPSSLPQRGLKSKTLTTAQCFRPRKMSLPRAKLGDAILLRNFKVQSLSKHLALISTDASGWAVFRKDKEVQMRGPPVEFGPEERGFARAHWNWWDSLGKEEKESLLAAAASKDTSAESTSREELGTSRRRGIGFDLPPSSSAGKAKINEHTESDTSASKPKSRKGAKHEGSPDFVQPPVPFVPEREVSETPSPPQTRLRSRKSKAAAAASLSPEKKSRKSDVQNLAVHELRDGTRYADEGRELNEGEENVLSPDTQIQVHRLRDGRTYPDRR